jgi:hypothetical protein
MGTVMVVVLGLLLLVCVCVCGEASMLWHFQRRVAPKWEKVVRRG